MTLHTPISMPDKKRKYLAPEEFVTVWQNADTIDEVVKVTGLTKDGALARANYYRKRKVPLQRFAKLRGGRRVNFDKLAALAAEVMARGNGRRKG